ncbi:MAG: multi-sensor hybrid histidine kinase [Planctomycetaceae bacterium]|nr:multi-sensor hybrid histidine kinase [Planctomycetaceae bacterium]
MTHTNQLTEIDALRLRLEEAEETIRAIRSGAVDAFVVEESHGARVYTLETADRPYRLLVEEMQQGALTLSNKGTIAYSNRCFAGLVGQPSERLVGVDFRNFIPLDAQPIFETLLQQGRAGASQGEIHVHDAAGTLVPVFLTFNALPPDSGPAIGLLVTDLTTQRYHEKVNGLLEALKEADRRKNEFLAMLSHELRSPLAPISNALQLLGLLKGNETPIQQQARNIIERQLGHLRRLVDDLLEVSRITTGRVQLHRERISISGIVYGAVETVRPLLEERHHELDLSVPSEPIWLYADAGRLEQVVANLLTNAAKYTEEKGRIWLTVGIEWQEPSGEWRVASGEKNHTLDSSSCISSSPLTTHHSPLATPFVVIRVRDTGVGIAPALLPLVFDLFTQAERTLDRSQGGLGIGLALVQRLTELHGGKVEAYSVLGQGSEFVVRLPVIPDENLLALPPIIATIPPSRSLRVLVVDDNIDTAQSFALLLKASGHEVRTAHDGPAAMQAALDYQPDVMVLDIGLPMLNGFEVAKQIRQLPVLKNIVMVALTGYGQEADRQVSRQAGFDHHLVKPACIEQLQQILTTVTAQQT